MHRRTRQFIASARRSLLPAVCVLLAAYLGFVGVVSAKSGDDRKHPDAAYSAGDATIFVSNQHAFGKSLPELPVSKLRDFAFGNRLFNTQWVTAPASVETLDGLGPVFNRNSCSGCHTRDGRGQPPTSPDEPMTSMLVRLSVPGTDEHGGPKPHPKYGDQINDRAILGVPAEGRVAVSWKPVHGKFADGTIYELRQPVYTFKALAFGELGDDVMFSPRVAPAVYGLGLLEAVPAETIQSFADADDTDGDGISGRPNDVWDVQRQKRVLGRFGWKANQPTLRQQIAAAFVGDIGITSSLFPAENVAAGQNDARGAKTGGEPELRDKFLDRITFYSQSLAVPAHRNVDDPHVVRGRKLFAAIGCAACHVPEMRTGKHPDVPQLSNQLIRPYTDLLLHDMGDGLADNRPDFEATGREWRTPPLWGLGLVKVVNGHTTLLHDGRARNAEEAILWHGGEGEASKEAYRKLSAEERAALLAFLESL